MKLFKDIDERFLDIGFVKIEESQLSIIYKRKHKEGYMHIIELSHRKNGLHQIMSYKRDVDIDRYSIIAGLTAYEMSLCVEKMVTANFDNDGYKNHVTLNILLMLLNHIMKRRHIND